LHLCISTLGALNFIWVDFMPNAGAMFKEIRQDTTRRQSAANEETTRGAGAGSDKQQQSSKKRRTSWKQRANRRAGLMGHRTFYFMQVVVAMAVMIFCMTQLFNAQQRKSECERNRPPRT
jgi:hypothetical protein